MTKVSSCCLRPIERGLRPVKTKPGEHSAYDQVDVCGCCGNEVGTKVEVFECCGLERCVCSNANVSTAS